MPRAGLWPRARRAIIAAMGARPDLEALRILGRYKRLVLLGKVFVPLAEGRRLVGPDTAFHLYSRHAKPAVARRRIRRSKARR